MAVIDFSNAVAQVAGTAHAIQKPYVILNDCYICSQNGTIIASNVNIYIIEQYPKFQATISGTMNDSGTEFYIYAKNGSSANTNYGYKISNILFSSGDTFSFNVSAEIIPYNYPPTPPVISDSWNYWTTTSGFKSDLGITKTNNGIAYYAAIHTTGDDRALLISPMSSAVEYDGYTQHGYIVDSNNITWWINAIGIISNYDSACLLSDTVYGDTANAARDLVSKIYAVPFHEDYQIGQEYRIPAYGDVRKTIRKIAGWQLAQNVSQYSTSTSYRTWSDNIDSTINTIIANINQHNNSNGMIIAQTLSDTDYGEYELFVMYGHFQTGYLPPKINYLDRAKILSSQQGQGNTHKLLEYYYDDTEGQYHWETYYVNAGLMEWQISAKVYSDEPTVIDFQDDDAALSSIWWNEAFIGTFIWDRQNRIDNVVITNIGIDL